MGLSISQALQGRIYKENGTVMKKGKTPNPRVRQYLFPLGLSRGKELEEWCRVQGGRRSL